jgi:hypothetical protein
MKRFNFQSHKRSLALLVLILFTVTLEAKKFVYNDGVIVNKTEAKIEEMANELYERTGISAYLLTKRKLDGKGIIEFEKEFAKKAKPPFAILCIVLNEQKVDIYNSADLKDSFDKEAILSPYPWEGSIIPLLTGKKKNVSISAAMLNGYADMVEQLANSKDIKLKSGIGSTNRDMILSLKFSMYLFLFVMIGWYFIRRRKSK